MTASCPPPRPQDVNIFATRSLRQPVTGILAPSYNRALKQAARCAVTAAMAGGMPLLGAGSATPDGDL